MPTFEDVDEEEKKEKPAPKKVTIAAASGGGDDKDDFKKRLAGMLAKGPRQPAVSSMVSRGPAVE